MGGSTVHFNLISFFHDVTIPLISVAMEKLPGFHTGFFSRGEGTFVCEKVDQLRP